MGRFFLSAFFVLMSFGAVKVYAFENAKVLPKGVRKVTLRHVQTTLSEKTNSSGHKESLAAPLAKELTFGQITKDYSGVALTQVKAFLMANGFSEEEAVGQFTADFAGNVTVTAPIFAYGISDRLTLGCAVPYYQARTNVAVGFQPNKRAQEFLNALSDPYTNQTAKAREAGRKLNNAVGELQNKLATNGYDNLGEWHDQGIGDTTVLAKYQALTMERFKVAVGGGVVAPTGRTDDPNNLTDIAFGDGQWDAVGQVLADQYISRWVYINEYVQYSNQLPGQKKTRLKTEAEPLEVPEKNVRFKLGDKIDAGVSLQYDGYEGVYAGLGYNISRKFSDRYYLSQEQAGEEKLLESNTEYQVSDAEFGLGYSSINAFKRGSIPVPFDTTLSYRKHLKSQNTPVRDLAQLDLTVYF